VPGHVRSKHHVVTVGPDDGRMVMLAHGFGCDQDTWRLVELLLSKDFRFVMFDFIGAGGSSLRVGRRALLQP
jgi:sigma-B regulation protein RsbQ